MSRMRRWKFAQFGLFDTSFCMAKLIDTIYFNVDPDNIFASLKNVSSGKSRHAALTDSRTI